jgi:hypothetical protein
MRKLGFPSLDLADEWSAVGSPNRIEAIESPSLPTTHKCAASRFPDDEALGFENTQRLAHCAQTYAELTMQVHLAWQEPAWLQLPALYALQHRISDLQIERSCLKLAIWNHADFSRSHVSPRLVAVAQDRARSTELECKKLVHLEPAQHPPANTSWRLCVGNIAALEQEAPRHA